MEGKLSVRMSEGIIRNHIIISLPTITYNTYKHVYKYIEISSDFNKKVPTLV